jgi:hypothetical protein
MKSRLLLLTALAVISSLAHAQSASPDGLARITSVEGITEYKLTNGLELLVFPDPSKPNVTVNITYLVGSRFEGPGEAGMAHLVEHMLFKGSPKHENIPQELTEHGPTEPPHGIAPITSRPSRGRTRICAGRWTLSPTGWSTPISKRRTWIKNSPW